ncbi:hypothetical protein [Wukongibacter sp. M2B1]|uniref:hypothetical protein n=1 Tax=Wukongibacter sp. M2B1 TaxID=3088895 RepID=UPI003D7A8DF6
MGYRLVSFGFVPDENEQLDVILKVPYEPRSVIQGVVKNYRNEVVKDAVVKLFKEKCMEPYELQPITHTFTDEWGHFIFGPLEPNQKYVIKVWIEDINNREIIIKPEVYYSDFDEVDNKFDDEEID